MEDSPIIWRRSPRTPGLFPEICKGFHVHFFTDSNHSAEKWSHNGIHYTQCMTVLQSSRTSKIFIYNQFISRNGLRQSWDMASPESIGPQHFPLLELICLDCCNKIPWTGFYAMKFISHSVLESGSPRRGCWNGGVLVRAVSWEPVCQAGTH